MPTNLSYSLRFPGNLHQCSRNIQKSAKNVTLVDSKRCAWYTNHLFPVDNFEERFMNSTDQPSYYAQSFLAIQNAITMSFIRSHNKTVSYKTLPEILVAQFPYASHVARPFDEYGSRLISLISSLSFTYAFVNSVRYIANEKEKQLKETMKIMGLSNWMHHLCWFFRSMIMLLIPIVIIAVVLTVATFITLFYIKIIQIIYESYLPMNFRHIASEQLTPFSRKRIASSY